jgi:hypothetical protein
MEAPSFFDTLTAGSPNGSFFPFRRADSWLPLIGVSAFAGSKMCKHFVTRIPDIPMAQMPINDFLSGLFPIAPISSTRPFQMGGLD